MGKTIDLFKEIKLTINERKNNFKNVYFFFCNDKCMIFEY
jgi:hypothetical protein